MSSAFCLYILEKERVWLLGPRPIAVYFSGPRPHLTPHQVSSSCPRIFLCLFPVLIFPFHLLVLKLDPVSSPVLVLLPTSGVCHRLSDAGHRLPVRILHTPYDIALLYSFPRVKVCSGLGSLLVVRNFSGRC